VRSEKRRRELALRGALGASYARLIRQFVTEALVLVLAGTGLGLLLADETMGVLRGMISRDLVNNMPFLDGLGLTAHVWVLAALLAVLAAGIFSVAPILRMPPAVRGICGSGWAHIW
jgi:ABC-type antimicrobial peptide transport system permease subunit